MKVFISYSHSPADAGLAHKIASSLKKEKIKVWIDTDSIDSGENWVQSINDGLEKSSHIIVLLTSASVASAWVRQEVSAAIVRHHRNQIQLLQLEVEDCTVPALWETFQRIPFKDYEQGFNKLHKKLLGKNAINKKPLPGNAELKKNAKNTTVDKSLAEIDTYAQLYDALYPKLPGDLRNYILNSVIVDQVYMLGSTSKFKPEVLSKFFNAGTAGRRMMTLLLLQTNPVADLFSQLLTAIAQPLSPFEQYHALRATALITHTLNDNKIKQLLKTLEQARSKYLVPANFSRWEEYQRILKIIDRLYAGKRKNR